MKRGGTEIKLTGGDWNVLSCLWEKGPLTVMELVAELQQRVGWAKSTTITTARRMETKGLLRCEQAGKTKRYFPTVEKEQAVTNETHSFLDRVYQGSVGLMMSAMARRQELSPEEIARLRAILDEAEEGVK